MDSQTSQSAVPAKSRRWPWVLGGVVVLTAVILGAGQIWIGKKIETVMREKLAERGLAIHHGMSTWDPWRGVHLTDVAIRRQDGMPLVEADSVAADFPLGQFFRGGERTSEWRVGRGALVLHDEGGAVRLEDVLLKMTVVGTEVQVEKFEAKHDGIEVAVSGQAKLKTRDPGEPPAEVRLPMKAVRGVLAALRLESGTLKVMGNFEVDARQPEKLWKADLIAKGKALTWQGVPLLGAEAKAVLTQSDSKIDAVMQLPSGAAEVTVSRENWQDADFVFSGKVKDTESREDDFQGTYAVSEKRFTVNRLSGAADLWSLADDVPFLASRVPQQITFPQFPSLVMEDFVRQETDGRVLWSVKSLTADGTAMLQVGGDRELRIDGLSGGAKFDGETWDFENVKAGVFGGRVALSGELKGTEVRDAAITVRQVRLADLKQWLNEEESSDKGLLSLDYRGSLDLTGSRMTGKGSLLLKDAPTFEAPLLEQTYQLFDALFPGIQKPREGEFEASFTGRGKQVEIDEFEARGGSLTVNAKGTVNLETRRVQGSARGRLTGVGGVVTSPLSRLLEMEVAGPFDDIRVKPLGPAKLASNAANGTVGVAQDVLKETGRITGTVLKEGAKLPFRIFGGKKDGKEKEERKR